MQQAPKIDERTAQEVFRALECKLSKGLKDRLGLGVEGVDPLTEALLRICARYSELIIQRLNRVPEKNYLAFLDLLAISRVPPVPAYVPLTFMPVKTLPEMRPPIVVPALTKVSAAPGEGESEPVVFETTRDLALTQFAIEKIIMLDPQLDLYGDNSTLTEGGLSVSAFRGSVPVDHIFYIGHEAVFGIGGISRLSLQFDIDEGVPIPQDQWVIEWRIPSAQGDKILIPSKDTTESLTQSGELTFTELDEWPSHTVSGREAHWLACRLLKRVPKQPEMVTGEGAKTENLPRLHSIAIAAAWQVEESMINAAFYNSMPIDLSRDFFPFGEHPRFGDVFYLTCDAFARQGAGITLNIMLTNPASAGDRSPIPPAGKGGAPVIQWEYWDGRRWHPLECQDETDALTEHGSVTFSVPVLLQATMINGLQGIWIRARLIAGSYGEHELVGYDQGFRSSASTLGPPSVQSITVDSSMSTGFQEPELLLLRNGLDLDVIAAKQSFQPFRPTAEPWPGIYLGFSAPERKHKGRAERTIDVYFLMDDLDDRLCLRSGSKMPAPGLVWQYWNGKCWKETSVNDETESFVSAGTVSVRIGKDIAPWQNCAWGGGFYWIRAQWVSGEFERIPKLRHVLLNTVTATHTVTLESELLGSSNGKPNQVFESARTPILNDLCLEVREPGMPPEEELIQLYQEEGDDVLTTVRNAQGVIEQIWVRWHETGDFLNSDHCDRHFIVNRQIGQIRFGDGDKGLIPPHGSNNVRLRKYQTGGGINGNKPAGSITQLHSSVPYVDKVSNLEPSSGGQDIEDWGALQERGSRALRHRDRAVTAEDYEDLARSASPVVAKAECYPGRDLAFDPTAKSMRAGVVSVVIVPRSVDPKPLPDMSLLTHVRDYIDQRRVPDTELVLLAPNYVRVIVGVSVVPDCLSKGAGLVFQCEQILERFLHPVYGGFDAKGWAFGKLPHESDLYALLESVPGLAYAGSLYIRTEAEHPDLIESGNYLIRSGEHRVELGSRL